MNELIIVAICLFASFIFTFFSTKIWIFVAKNIKLQGKDMNKFDKPKVSEAGGISPVMSIAVSLMLYVFFKIYLLGSETNLIPIFAIIIGLVMASFIGLLDDVLGWLKGIRQKTKVMMSLSLAIPLVIVNAGQSLVNIPFVGPIEFGLIYPLLIIPLGVVFASNGYNMLAGYNGLEAGLGVIIISTLSYVAYLGGLFWLTMVGGITVAALLAFLVFNWYPSKVFPGDSLTYAIGFLIAAMAIFGNMETIAVVLFVPFMVDFILTSRSNMQAEAFGKVNKDNSLNLPYDKFYDSTHVAIWLIEKIKGKVYEREVVLAIYLFELVFVVLALGFLV